MTQTPSRDWQKDMERVNIFEHAKTLCNNPFPPSIEYEPTEVALGYWLQEAKFYQGELSDCYKAVEQQQEEIRELTLAKYREIERADAAEAREQRLKEALELMVYMFRYDLEEGRAYMNFGDFEEVLEPDDNAAYISVSNLLRTLYPDTPAPTPAITARPIDEWHEDYGDVLWWEFPIVEPPYCGCPLDADWPEYHTHWTQIVIPTAPAPKEGESDDESI